MSGTSLPVQWLRLCTVAGGTGSIPGRGTKIPQAPWHGQNKNINKCFSSTLLQIQVKYDQWDLKVGNKTCMNISH